MSVWSVMISGCRGGWVGAQLRECYRLGMLLTLAV
jgi:hypothetical protein